MGQRIHAGRRADVRRQPGHQRGVERGHQRHQLAIDHRGLRLCRGIGDHGHDGDFRTGTRSGGYRIDRQRRQFDLEIPDQIGNRRGVGNARGDDLRGIHRRAAADREHRIAAIAARQRHTGLDLPVGGIGFHPVIHGTRHAVRFESLPQRPDQTELHQHRIGHDQHLAGAKIGHRAAHPQRGTRAGKQQRLPGADQFHDDFQDEQLQVVQQQLQGIGHGILQSGNRCFRRQTTTRSITRHEVPL